MKKAQYLTFNYHARIVPIYIIRNHIDFVMIHSFMLHKVTSTAVTYVTSVTLVHVTRIFLV